MAPCLHAVPNGQLPAGWGIRGPGGLISIVVAVSQENAIAYHVVLVKGVHLFVICPQLTCLIKVTEHCEQFCANKFDEAFSREMQLCETNSKIVKILVKT